MFLGIGMGFLMLAGCVTDGWAGLTDLQWSAVLALIGLAFIGLHYSIKAARRAFRRKVNREVERKIYYYLNQNR